MYKNTEALDILKIKREKFTINIRKQKTEAIFSEKRRKLLRQHINHVNNMVDQRQPDKINTLTDSCLYAIQSVLNRDANFLLSMGEIKLWLMEDSMRQTIQENLQVFINLIPTLLEIIGNVNGSEDEIGRAQDILIDLTYHMQKEEIQQMTHQPLFQNICRTLNTQSDGMKTDCLTLMTNIMADLNINERDLQFQRLGLIELLIDASMTWGGSEKYHKKSFKLMCLNNCIQEEQIFNIIGHIESVITNQNQNYKLESVAFRLLWNVVRKHLNVDKLINMEFPAIIINYLQATDDNYERRSSVLYLLEIVHYLILESDNWAKSLVFGGLPSGLQNVIQSQIYTEYKHFDLVIRITANLFKMDDDQTYLIMQNKQDYIELLLSHLSEHVKAAETILPSACTLLITLLMRPKYVQIVLESVNVFKILCEVMEGFNCYPTNDFDQEEWMTAVAVVMRYGEQTNQTERFVGQFIRENGPLILELLQSSNSEEVVKMSHHIMDWIE